MRDSSMVSHINAALVAALLVASCVVLSSHAYHSDSEREELDPEEYTVMCPEPWWTPVADLLLFLESCENHVREVLD